MGARATTPIYYMKKYFIFSNHQLLLKNNDNNYLLPDFSEIKNIVKTDNEYCIGNFFDDDCYAIEVFSHIPVENHAWVTLRVALDRLEPQWYSIAARAYQIIQWDLNHHYCGKCGKITHKIQNQFERKCEACHLSFFPKISPAVIVLIKKEKQILMARAKHFAPGVHALIAGFVEAGETLEDAVHREVFEEVNIKIKNICYWGSQSWPFPDSLMIGFIAEYDSGEIACRDGELETAGWYDAHHLPGLPSSRSSISRKMIDAFFKNHS